MRTQNQRVNKRFPLTIRATVINPDTMIEYECIIRDGSVTGCKILCEHIDDLPEQIGLNVPVIGQIIGGRIAWRGSKSAGIAFSWDTTDSNERRGAPRKKTDLPAIVLGYDFKPIVKCRICDISWTGCRIAVPGDAVIPAKIRFEVENLTRAVMGRIVWREGNQAGVEFVQDSDVCILEDDGEAELVDT